MRALWGALAPDQALLQRAFSLDTVGEELIFLTGPLLVVAVHPVPGLVLSGVLIGAGALALAASPATRLIAPAVRAASPQPRSRLRLFGPHGAGVRRASYAALGMGACMSGLELYVIAFAGRAHHPGAVGWILAAQSAGSAVGGLVYGRLSWRLPPGAQLPYLLLVMAALLAANSLAFNVPVLLVCVAAAGTLSSPTLSTAYLAAARAAPDGTATVATTWVNSAINAGSSLGGALAALVVAQLPLPVCFLLAAAVPAVAALAARPDRLRVKAPLRRGFRLQRASRLPRKDREGVGGRAAGLGGADQESLAGGALDVEALVGQLDAPGDRVAEDLGRAAEAAHLVAPPQIRELLAPGEQFADDRGEPGVVPVVPRGEPQRLDRLPRDSRPVGEELLRGGVEEQRANHGAGVREG